MAKTSLFVGDLSIFCKEADIRNMFAPFGDILEIKIMRNEHTSQNLSYGFLKYSNPLSAKRAMTELNQVVLCGRPMRINWASYRKKNHSKDPKDSSSELSSSPIHVSFISYQVAYLVTEASLRVLFSKFGDVVDVTLKKSSVEEDIPRQSGYGFVHYSVDQDGIRASIRAVQALTDVTVDDVNYKSCLSHNLRRLLAAYQFDELGDVSTPDLNVADKSEQSSYGSSLNYNGGVIYQSSPANAPPMMESFQSASADSGNMMVNDSNLSLSTHVLQGDSYQGGPMSYCTIMPPSPPAVYAYTDSSSNSPHTSYRVPTTAVFNSNNLELINNGMSMQHTVPVFTSAPPSPSDNSYMGSPLQQVVTGERGYFNTYVDYGYSSPYPHWGTPSPVTMTRDIIVEGICHMLTPTSNYYPSPVMGGRHPLSFQQNMNAGTQVVYGGSGYSTFPVQASNNRFTTPEASFSNSSMKPAQIPSASTRSNTKSSRSIINSLRSKQTAEGMNVKDSAP